MAKIKIQGYNKNVGSWVKSVPDTSFNFEYTIKGYKFAHTKRNYYYDSKQKKVRYETMSVGRASYKHIYNCYILVDDVYCYAGTATENNLEQHMTSRATVLVNMNPDDVDNFINNLVTVN